MMLIVQVDLISTSRSERTIEPPSDVRQLAVRLRDIAGSGCEVSSTDSGCKKHWGAPSD